MSFVRRKFSESSSSFIRIRIPRWFQARSTFTGMNFNRAELTLRHSNNRVHFPQLYSVESFRKGMNLPISPLTGEILVVQSNDPVYFKARRRGNLGYISHRELKNYVIPLVGKYSSYRRLICCLKLLRITKMSLLVFIVNSLLFPARLIVPREISFEFWIVRNIRERWDSRARNLHVFLFIETTIRIKTFILQTFSTIRGRLRSKEIRNEFDFSFNEITKRFFLPFSV